ncbi:MAG: (1-_4)-alpha-D-glucan 1-alpha-D-glucosylmutase [Acidobacteriota bacterium]|jgi:(1->4)-alpha-D-glucan 1-alpha-D-glucosylmutase|nr:(1->4)-alpha-D-glucan 1-alpha-D-glucosylmutase [Acidobacteriota bacterium]
MYRVPAATYRIQFNASFTFDDARGIASYLADLGISDIYASPILKARKGSTHGYDVVDATALNPELGTDDDFNALHAELQERKLGFLLDIVPNHMAASPENVWWISVLENGPHSRFLHYFDIDWSPVTAHGRTANRVLLPILGRPYGEAVEAQEIRLGFDQDGFFFQYYDHRLPLAPESYRLVLRECVDSLPTEGAGVELRELMAGDEAVPNSKFLKSTIWRIYEQDAQFRDALEHAIEKLNGTAGDAESFNALDALLDAQWYRLAYWRIASEKINYRRFFDVTDLVGVRVENPEVFEARNRRTLELIAEGKVTGLRIDHIDGLYDPIGHMKKMQLRLADPDDSGSKQFYVVVEKILAKDEELPEDFPVSGTTGYDFLDTLNTVFINDAGVAELTTFYRDFTGITKSFEEIVYERKKQVIQELFSGEMRALGKQISKLAMDDRNGRDFAPTDLLSALTEITACMPVYRTYIREGEVSDADRHYLGEAVAKARRRASSLIDERIFAFMERVLLVDPPSYVAAERDRWLAFVLRWQQFTGRVMAKGVEDTAFYNFNRLISMNDVGGEPGRDAPFDGLAELHRRNEAIAHTWPHTLNATSTHDTKRSEDVRARINVLSELAGEWQEQVMRWSELTKKHRRDGVPAPNEELLVYQTLVGMWPLDEEEQATVADRLKQYLEKAAREAKTHTSWIAPNAAYEEALLAFGEAVVNDDEFRAAFADFQKRVAFYGFLNSIAQVVLKIASPGVPDFYQGTELWDFSLVDPDNRRPVDYDTRRAMLRKLATAKTLDFGTMLRRWRDARVKLYVTWKALELRARREELFRDAGYAPIDGGPNVAAFARGEELVVAVPHLVTKLVEPGTSPLGEVWGDRTIAVPPEGTWRNVFTGETWSGDALRLADVFATFPVAMLERV